MDSPVDPEIMHAYNRAKRVGRTYLDGDGDPTFEMSMWLEGGVSEANIRSYHQLFLAPLVVC